MTTYTKAEREFWERCCSQGDPVFSQDCRPRAAELATSLAARKESHANMAQRAALLADAKLEEWRKRFVPEAAEESCARCKWHDGDSCKRFTEDNAYVCISNSLAWFAEKETDR